MTPDAPEDLKGRLLVATPALNDPNFERTVVLILEHGDDGAVGVVLNRPSETDLSDPLPGWQRLATDPRVIFVGGPVAPDAAICLAQSWPDEHIEAYQPLLDSLGTVDLSVDPDDVSSALAAVRVFVGYAGWGAGQLEDEIEAGAWFVVDARPDDALSADPESLWEAVLRRQPGTLAMFANFPANPSFN
ncbi:MAG: YqgE/AlgH family protein [Acidimicrobiales bacterium]